MTENVPDEARIIELSTLAEAKQKTTLKWELTNKRSVPYGLYRMSTKSILELKKLSSTN